MPHQKKYVIHLDPSGGSTRRKKSKNSTAISVRKQTSYWENAFLIAGLENISENSAVSKFDIEKLLHHIGNLRDSSNTIKYLIFSAFMKYVLSISHGKSALKSRFSINKHILDIHGYSLKEDTIEALRVVKDAILRNPSLFDVPVTKEMLRSVKGSRQRYQVDLEAKRLLLEKESSHKDRRRKKEKR